MACALMILALGYSASSGVDASSVVRRVNLTSQEKMIAADGIEAFASPLRCQSGMVALQADTGKYLTLCNNCVPGEAYPDAADFHSSVTTVAWAQWIVTVLPSGNIGFQSAHSKRFLARCNKCYSKGATTPDAAFIHDSNVGNSWAQWTVTTLSSGKVALKADTGKYLARCNNCVTGANFPDAATVHATYPPPAWAQFKVACIPPPPKLGCSSGKMALQTDTGNFLTMCNNCVPGEAYPDAADFHSSVPTVAWAQWFVKDLPSGKIGLQNALSNRLLARCNNCYAKGASTSDAAFVHVSNIGDVWAQWTAWMLPGGKVALQADTGNYLARCNNCVTGANFPDAATVHATDSTPSWAQFKIVCI